MASIPCLRAISLFLAVSVATPGIRADAAGQVKTPSQFYGQLFEDVQMQRVFPDSKTFVDAIAKDAPAIIIQRYDEEKQKPGFDLAAFVARNSWSTTWPRAASSYARWAWSRSRASIKVDQKSWLASHRSSG